MNCQPKWECALILAALLALGGSAHARDRSLPAGAQFKYVGGTEGLQEGCEGKLEVGATNLIFSCLGGSVSVPYPSITLMQYRPDISRQVWKMKLKWKVKPALESPIVGRRRNRYFTVLYTEHGATHAVVLNVPPGTMRPYLAEIDLKAGKRVEVKSSEEYD